MDETEDIQLGQKYRSMMYTEVVLSVDPSTRAPRRAQILRICPALNVGAPATGNQARDQPIMRGARSMHAYTAPSAGQWKSTIDASVWRK